MSIERLSAEDQLMWRWDDRWPQNIGALAILEGSALLGPGAQFRLDAARRRIAERLHLLPRFRQVIHTPRRGLGDPPWIDAPGFALEEHVHALPPPSGGESGLLALGRNDHWAAPEVAVASFEALRAPSKRLVWFERSGHEPFADEPDKFNAVMLNEVLPAAAAARSRSVA